jgi:galactokinase
MFQTTENLKHNLPGVSEFIETVEASGEFSGDAEIYIARAPGRLDVMGGIADYSGSLVLEMPIAEAALVALQPIDARKLKIISLGAEENDRTHVYEMSLDDFTKNGAAISYAEAQRNFKLDAVNSWAAYIAGAFLVLISEKNIRFERGATILIDSKVPEGKGVSSSAALEVAVMNAVAAAFKIEINPRELAILCQKVENLVVGAPCGIMDQMSSSCGEANKLLSMICQPAELRGTVEIPEDLAVWGIDSGIRHSVGAGDYGSVRTGAFMGYRIIAELAGLKVISTEIDGVVKIADEKWNGYLANISPAEFEENYAAHLPGEISGAVFLDKYQGITDTVTRVAPERNYQIFHPTAHPVYENFRVHRFAELLKERPTETNLSELGSLMYQSHESYTACGLGTSGTDLLVELVKKSPKLYGAKITGGGSGGTVAVLGRKEADSEIRKIAEQYEQQTGHRPYIFSGSSPGAATFGVLTLK